MWYLVIKKEYYDRSYYEVARFITQTPDKFQSSEKQGLLYIKEKIKVK